jgi:hypothetical protein
MFDKTKDGEWVCAEGDRHDKTIKLPCYGIVVTFALYESGELRSDLSSGHHARNKFDIWIDGIESMILAHAIAGVDIESPAYIEGIETAVEAVANHI